MHVSAIVAVYNGADRLAEALDSILAQEYAPFEIIVIDDGSTDATPDVISSYGTKIRPFRKDHGGLSAAHNFAIGKARGDAIAFLDHDDLWPSHALSSMVGLLDADATIDIASGKVEMRYERREPPSELMQRCLIEANRPYMMHSLLIRRSVFDRIGGFDESLTHAMDVDWYMRARDGGMCFGFVPEITMIYRMHDTNMTRDVFATTQGIVAAFKHSLDRRRTGQ